MSVWGNVWRNIWERVFNAQSDLDWAWGPLLPLRPPQDVPIRPWLWARLFLIFTALGLVLLGLLTGAVLLVPRAAARAHWMTPPPVTETLATLGVMAADAGTRALVVGLMLALPPLFFLFCLPYHWAWNRRAARPPVPTEGAAGGRGVWPPAPEKNNSRRP